MPSYYLVVGLPLKRSCYTLIDQKGKVLNEIILNQKLEASFGNHIPKDTYAVMEATRNWTFLYFFS
jgi:hypothetical protein